MVANLMDVTRRLAKRDVAEAWQRSVFTDLSATLPHPELDESLSLAEIHEGAAPA